MALASCNSPKSAGENPFFTQWDTPFGVPPFDKIRAEHFMPAFERGMSLHDAEIDAITSNNDEPTFENTILAYDNAGQMLAQTELIFGMLCAAETNERMQALQEQVMPLLSAHRDKIRLDEKLFARVKDVYDRRASLGLDAEQSRLLRKTYDAFVRSGALLDAGQKARLKDINGELSLTAVKFGNNILAENNNFALELTADDLEGLPSGVRDAAREKAQAMGKGDKLGMEQLDCLAELGNHAALNHILATGTIKKACGQRRNGNIPQLRSRSPHFGRAQALVQIGKDGQ